MSNKYKKDPQAKLDYVWDWSDWLGAGETITTATVTVSDTSLVVGAVTHTAESVTAWLTGGLVGKGYAVVCHIVTSVLREDDRTIYINCYNR